MASGLHNKLVPEVPGKEKFKGKILHNSEVLSPDILIGKNVVVIGGSKGAWDMLNRADDAETKSTTAIMGNIRQYIPSAKRWGISSGVFSSTRFPTFFILNIDPNGTNYVYQYGGLAKKLFFGLLRSYNNDVPEYLRGSYEVEKVFPLRSTRRDDKAIDAIKKKRIKWVKGRPEEITPEGIIVGGDFYPADLIIFATGGQRFNFGIGPQTGEFWLYRNSIKPGVKNLAFVGQVETVFTPTTNVITSCWLIDILRGKVKLPSVENMNQEVDWLKNKIEKQYGNSPGRSNGWLTIPLVDLMLRDMGINIRRKKNYYEHWFRNILPEDYLGVITHRK